MQVHFSDFFEVDPDILERYGAFNVSLINDLPLFIDPFLLFNRKKAQNERTCHQRKSNAITLCITMTSLLSRLTQHV
jgi:hypothetical protein